jgi:multiple sugar transport system substrate-binding protein
MKRTGTMAVAALLSLVVAACGEAATTTTAAPGETVAPGETTVPEDPGALGPITVFSTQANPPEEQQAIIDQVFIPSGFEVEFLPAEEGVFVDRVLAEAAAGRVETDVLMALHGSFPSFQEAGALMDLSDLAAELAGEGIAEDFLALGRLGTDTQYYIPVIQATFLMAAHRDALQYLPEGADVNALTWEQLADWAAAAHTGEGRPVLGFPAGEQGLIHRFVQGYLYPSFTGTMVTGFDSPQALEMWSFVVDLWEHVSPQANTYAFMQEQLLAGDVLIAFDHQARLKDAIDQSPDDFVVFPAPIGPSGLGYMAVLVGLAIPEGAPNEAGARELIKFLLSPEGQVGLTRAIGFFPVTGAEIPSDAEPSIQAEAQAAAAQVGSSEGLPALLPVGLGELGGEFNNGYRNTFLRIVIDREDIASVLAAEGSNIQRMLDESGAPCWPPDPPSDGACQLDR